jgi:hypothetical protein
MPHAPIAFPANGPDEMRFRHRRRSAAPAIEPGPAANIGTASAGASRARNARRHPQRRFRFRHSSPAFGLAFALLITAAPARAAGPPGGEDRLLDSFAEDAALIDKAWIEFAFQARAADEGDDFGLGVIAAFRYGRDVEAGFDVMLLDREREAGAPLFGVEVPTSFGHTGLADPSVYGKYRLLRGACDLSIGAKVSFPAAPDDSGLTSGAIVGRGFVAFRGAWRRAALIGHLGLGASDDSGYEQGAEGETFATGSFGAVVGLSRLWNLTAEVDFEGARFEGEEERGRGVVGLDWHPTVNIRVRGGLGSGWGRDAGAIRGLAAMAFHF